MNPSEAPCVLALPVLVGITPQQAGQVSCAVRINRRFAGYEEDSLKIMPRLFARIQLELYPLRVVTFCSI